MIEKQTKRLRKAFPSMSSEKINQFLKQKVEFKKQEKKQKRGKNMEHEIFIIDNETNLINKVKEMFKSEKGYRFKNVKTKGIIKCQT